MAYLTSLSDSSEAQIVEQTYKDLNYNAKCNDCYALVEVQEVLRVYNSLASKGSVKYWLPGSSDNTAIINMVAMNTGNSSNSDDRARVAAMLYQYYYTKLRLNGAGTTPAQTPATPAADTKKTTPASSGKTTTPALNPTVDPTKQDSGSGFPIYYYVLAAVGGLGLVYFLKKKKIL